MSPLSFAEGKKHGTGLTPVGYKKGTKKGGKKGGKK